MIALFWGVAYIIIAIMVIEAFYVVYGTVAEVEEPTWQKKMLDRLQEWKIYTALNQTLEISDISDRYCAEFDNNVLEYCFLGNRVISCVDDMNACIKAQKLLDEVQK